MCAIAEVLLPVGELNLAVGGMNITVDRSGDLEWILTRGSDTAEMIWFRLVEVFVITTEMAGLVQRREM